MALYLSIFTLSWAVPQLYSGHWDGGRYVQVKVGGIRTCASKFWHVALDKAMESHAVFCFFMEELLPALVFCLDDFLIGGEGASALGFCGIFQMQGDFSIAGGMASLFQGLTFGMWGGVVPLSTNGTTSMLLFAAVIIFTGVP
ncbi:hypothetical protein EDC04DRAFT_2601410 [Pisolithus marmoratus]|nr:hypothetical protein EDC04DRAFT_2601410 [Pisolithus marmoratus]